MFNNYVKLAIFGIFLFKFSKQAHGFAFTYWKYNLKWN